jgi:hypothetical protein
MYFNVGVNYLRHFFIHAEICNISCNFGSKANRTKVKTFVFLYSKES